MKKRLMKWLAIAAFSGLLIACSIYVAVPDLRWRVDAIILKGTGQIDGISMGELVPMLVPGNGFYIEQIVATRNPYTAIYNPHNSAEDVSSGQRHFEEHCTKCHGSEGVGNVGPALNTGQMAIGDSDWALFKALRDGLPGTAMPASPLSQREIWSVIAYVRNLQYGSSAVERPEILDYKPVTNEELLSSRDRPQNWITYSGSYDGQRYSNLDQVDTENAHSLTLDWVYQFQGNSDIHEASPIVVGTTMFLTEAPNTVHALNAVSGERIWTYVHTNEDGLSLCCGDVNRGLAVHGDTLFMGTLDSHLVALDARTGALKWRRKLHDHRLGSSITAAPLVVDGKVIVGYGGGDMGFRGFIDALDASDGTPLWRFYTVPGEGEPGNETWSGDSWKTGGAATWLTGTYDPENGLLYWTTGNPAPDFQGDLRLGDNLYSCSVVAIDLETGELRWHFQFTPHDEHDWDSNQIPVLVDREWHGEQRRLLMTANRNGFFYVLDRDTGEFLLAKEFAEQNWALGIDENGRPILNPETILTTDGVATWPSPYGATNWHSPSNNRQTGLFYVSALEFGNIVYKDTEPADYEPGEAFVGGGPRPLPGNPDFYFAVRAIDPESGNITWEHKYDDRNRWWKTGGILNTAGNVMMVGDRTEIYVLDARDGTVLWRRNVGGLINAAPITYTLAGKQRFALIAGKSLYTFALQ